MNYSPVVACGHCGNISRMEILGYIGDTEKIDVDDNQPYEEGTYYEVRKCPACKKINIVSYFWTDLFEMDAEDVTYEEIYPSEKKFPRGLPDTIERAYLAADKVKTIDVNAYAVLTRRLLELVCLDRSASGTSLAIMLKDLADKNEIPQKLVNVAIGLKNLGNIGAHASIGELSEKELPILNALTNAILEYIYSAPYLANLAEQTLVGVKNKKQNKKNKTV